MLKKVLNKLSESLKGFQKNTSASLFRDIVDKFDVSEKFVLQYQKLRPEHNWYVKDWDTFLSTLPSLDKMHISYVMSTVIRGRYTYSLLESYSRISNKNRYLDIGTAYAGFLRAFKENGFKEVIGIELQERLANLGRANLDGIEGARILQGNFVEDDYSHLGTFDVVTCNDVIEHVDDAEVAIKKMTDMVAEQGCLSLEIPNKDCIHFVKSDGHFQIFGITQLNKDDSAEYYEAILNADRKNYYFQMGEMYELIWYFREISKHGLSVSIADTHKFAEFTDVPDLLEDLRQSYKNWEKKTAPQLSPAIVEKVRNAVDNYIALVESDAALVKDNISKRYFEDKYLRSFWTVLANKNEPSVVEKEAIQKGYMHVLETAIGQKDAHQHTALNNQLNEHKVLVGWSLPRLIQFLKRYAFHPIQGIKRIIEFIKNKQ